ncbi:murein biosynthesis integral membrane protein MurJ [bacterium]|nr:MAG: murein biosynthesis integral membrane protein MurJ [bacterium]
MALGKEQHKVLKWAFFSSLGTLGSRFAGLFREIVMAALFGTGMVADAFSAAFRFPNLLRRVFGEGGLLVVLVPRYSQERVRFNDDEAFILASSVAVMLGLTVGIIIIIGELTAPYLAWVFAHGWLDQPEKFALTVRLLRLLYPFVGFIAFATWASAILNAHKKFFLPSLAPAFLNLGWLAGALVTLYFYRGAAPQTQAYIVAGGVLVGGMLQFIVQVPFLKKIGFKFKSDIRRKIDGVIEIGKLLVPALGALAVIEINFVVDTLLASFLPQGSVSALTYANRLIYLPMGLAGVAMAQATLPKLSDLAAATNYLEFEKMLSFSTRTIFGIMLPISALLMSSSSEIVSFLFQRGSFSGTVSTPMTAFALKLYAIGLFAFGANKILMQGFYALKDTKTPMILSAIVVALNIALNLLLIGPLKHGGLALATSLASIIHTILLLIFLNRKGTLSIKPQIISFLRVFGASILIFAITKVSSIGVHSLIGEHSFWQRSIQLGVPAIVWFVVVLSIAKILKIPEIEQFLELFFQKMKKIISK